MFSFFFFNHNNFLHDVIYHSKKYNIKCLGYDVAVVVIGGMFLNLEPVTYGNLLDFCDHNASLFWFKQTTVNMEK